MIMNQDLKRNSVINNDEFTEINKEYLLPVKDEMDVHLGNFHLTKLNTIK